MALSSTEKQDLAGILEIVFGHDTAIHSRVNRFNGRTMAAAEDALETMVRCNDNMRRLVTGLLGGASVLVKGWLREIVSRLRKELESGRIQFDGYACKVFTVNNWRTPIVLTLQ
ncbi:hypothetical protein CF392_14440 [Tamilnaduibacter salinus]|uniref:Uncharacterized protein n=1 Tax=Tamilnaduibacter salinus TaxID=1484056 RepID=A0A2A2I174_9GAMM|nr:hypothetical protein [Tamilnaduibacter salinus]PAV24763.1 hypothetical protein CF392_14440 [Tamilnaduibacter salinus]